MEEEQLKHTKIVISDKKHALPYSKGLMATSIMATGMPPDVAYNIATKIQDRLVEEGIKTITVKELRNAGAEMIAHEVGEHYAEIYRKWQALGKLDKPLVILIGGATGVGKSTVANMLATRLGINRTVSTDVVRQVMRSLFTSELMPTLHNSSFSAWQGMNLPLPSTTDKVIVGFIEQAGVVAVGVRALVERATVEGTYFIIEGAHVVPSCVDPNHFKDAFVVQLVLAVRDEKQHRSHFGLREIETEGSRPFERYMANFECIRKIQDYILELAEINRVPVFPCYDLDTTVGAVMEYILGQIFEDYTPGEIKEEDVEKYLEISTRRESKR